METKIYCGIDIASENHHAVAIDENEQVILNKKVKQDIKEINQFLDELQEKAGTKEVVIGIEGKNGYCKPMDTLIIDRNILLYNINNLNLKRFKEIYPGECKNDEIDARMIAKMLKINEAVMVKENKMYMEIINVRPEVEKIKKYSRFQQKLINDKVKEQLQLEKLLLEICPEILKIAKVDTIKLLTLLNKYPDFTKYKNLKEYKLMKIKNIGKKWVEINYKKLVNIKCMEIEAKASSRIIKIYTKRIIELKEEIKNFDKMLEEIGKDVKEVQLLKTIPGVSNKLASRFVGEIGSIERFETSAKLAAYTGVACINKDSGKVTTTHSAYKSNKICKNVMTQMANSMVVHSAESKEYYKRKKREGKKHNHALRCLSRQLIKIIFQMLKSERPYININKETKKNQEEIGKICA